VRPNSNGLQNFGRYGVSAAAPYRSGQCAGKWYIDSCDGDLHITLSAHLLSNPGNVADYLCILAYYPPGSTLLRVQAPTGATPPGALLRIAPLIRPRAASETRAHPAAQTCGVDVSKIPCFSANEGLATEKLPCVALKSKLGDTHDEAFGFPARNVREVAWQDIAGLQYEPRMLTLSSPSPS
jgi:hypothetical protein